MSSVENILPDFGVSQQDIDKARAYQRRNGGALERLLVNMGSLPEDLLPQLYSRVLNWPLLDEDILTDWQPPETDELNHHFLHQRQWLLFSQDDDGYRFATARPLDWDVLQYLQQQPHEYHGLLTSEEQFERLLHLLAEPEAGEDSLAVLSDLEEDKLRELASEAPTVNLLNSLIARALRQNASDMHLEPHQGRYRVRYRIDGVLHDVETIAPRLQLAVISRLKILSGMDIAEKRRPQDGKIEMKIAGIELDIRVSALPLNDGESIVMRFLRKDNVNYDLAYMGLAEDIQRWIREDLTRTSGVVLMTGPTGSGKTTSLYTFLNELNDSRRKIITLEDPVEYQLAGINQVQVRPEIGFDFSAGLRSIVRQDPDIIMVGEIRDGETAHIAMQSALTGHLVFSTVHTNDAPSTYTRLIDLGLEEYLLNAAVIAIMAQRLARRLCPQCATEHPDAQALIAKYQLDQLAADHQLDDIRLLQAQGCEACANTGYRGRMALIEYLRNDEHIQSLAKDATFLPKAREHNHRLGRRTLLQDGLLKAITGQTSIDEVIRVCG